jgi:hypothetical protein
VIGLGISKQLFKLEVSMLYISANDKNGCTEEWQTWHVGEPIPKVTYSNVVTFQADGDELDLLIEAMEQVKAKV